MSSELSRNMRAGIVDILELISNMESQLRYQIQAPSVRVASELFNQWDDAYHPHAEEFRRGFTAAELAALRAFDSTLDDVAARTPQMLPPLDEFIQTAEWKVMSDAATVALRALGCDGAGGA